MDSREISTNQPDIEKIGLLLKKAKALAIQYYRLTGRPLGITGEIAEFEVTTKLGLQLAPVRSAGFDAFEVKDGMQKKYQIKGRCISRGSSGQQRIGGFRFNHDWDAVLLVLMDMNFEPHEILEASRSEIQKVFEESTSKAIRLRGAMSVSKFRSVATIRWVKERNRNGEPGRTQARQKKQAPPMVQSTKQKEVNLAEIQARLLKFERQIKSEVLFPALEGGASEFATRDPYAFCLAACLDRGTKADLIWTIPYWIFKDLGHLDPRKIYLLSIDEITDLVSRLPKKPRYIDVAPRTIKEITKIVVERFDGDASLIWKGKKASDVHATFLSVFGVGPGIASMTVILIEKAFGIRFSDLDRRTMDIKPDVNTMRVLYRLGVAPARKEANAIEAARLINPSFPGEIDGALWMIGRNWCVESDPDCSSCPLNSACLKCDH